MANAIEAFEDMPYCYDNWEISPYYKQKKWNVTDLQSITPIFDGARAGFAIERKFLNSTIRQNAYVLNKPLVAVPATGNGEVKSKFSLVSANKENIIIDTVKQAENSNATVVRAYDAYNRRGKVKFTFGFDIKKAFLCDMLENKLKELDVTNSNEVELNVSNFEIVTIMVE